MILPVSYTGHHVLDIGRRQEEEMRCVDLNTVKSRLFRAYS